MNIIAVNNLKKEYVYKVRNNKKGFFYNLLHRDKELSVRAIDIDSLVVKKGEAVAFIGPNGAGKSTMIKMLTGILYPTSGNINVCGLTPIKDRKLLAHKIGTVFGQRSQLLPNLPFTESMEMFGAMYDMTKKQIEDRTNELIELFELKDFINQPVRKLSLGQRMRAEIAVSFFHKPEVVFLDEPTIGLDIVSKKTLRELLKRINKEQKTTIFLTSHDTDDIESICNRCIIINHGNIIVDLPTKQLISKYVKYKKILINLVKKPKIYPRLSQGLTYLIKDGTYVEVGVDMDYISIKDAICNLINKFNTNDISVENEVLENIIRGIYEKN